MTYEELMEFALKHYCHGGDSLYEAWDRQAYAEYVAEFGEMTEEDALCQFRVWESVRLEMEATEW